MLTIERQRGATLVEVIIFIVVVSVAVGAMLGVFSEAMRGAGTEAEAVRASHLAQQRMELLVGQKREGDPGLDFSGQGAFEDSCDDAVDAVDGLDHWQPPGDYTVDHTCDHDPDGEGDYHGRIEITVTIQGRSYTLTTDVYHFLNE